MGDEKKTEDFASGPAVTAPDGRKGNCPRRDMASPGPVKPAGALRASVKPGSPAADAQKRKAYRRLPGQFRTAFLGVCVLLILFLRTRLGLSIRATGDNPDMVRASSINTRVTVTIGLCAANAVTALSGAILAQYQKTADINLGTGMVIIGLASLIIGETIFGRGGIPLKVVGAVAGSVIYRFIIAVALRLNLPAECLKLISAVIVALAIALPYLRQQHKSRPRADRTERSV